MRAKARVSMDQTVLEAYERYVLAQFKHTDEDKIEKERASAIESLIPGTVNYFHLFFLDLVKKKKTIDEFTDEEIKLYNIFEEKYGTTTQFTEIETWVLVVNRIEGLPRVNSDTNAEDIGQNIDVIEYLYDNYIKKDLIFRKPAVLEEEDHSEESSLIEDKKEKLQTLDLDGKFDRAKIAKSLEEKILKKLKEWESKRRGDIKKSGFDYAKNLSHEDQQEIINFADELNWQLFTNDSVYSFKELLDH